MLRHLELRCLTDWPKSKRLDDLLGPLSACGATLQVVSIFKTYAGPATTLAASADFFRRVPNLVDFRVQGANLTGPVPPELGCCPKLTNLQVWGNAFSGTIPAELANCAMLPSLGGLEKPKMSGIVGPVPPAVLAMPCLTQPTRDFLARK